MNTNEEQALLAHIQENLADLAPQLIFSDWLEEQDRLQEALYWRGQKATSQDLYDLYHFSYSYDYGNGDGHSYDYGNGDGHGHGAGYGFRYDDSAGYGYGDGYGYNYAQRRTDWLEKHKRIMNFKNYE